jgi:hypothetical protein
MNALFGLACIAVGMTLLIRVWIKPYEKSSWLFNTQAVAIAIGLIIIGVMYLSE